jgi:D-threo-aldose 1-dehydrogenase
VSREPSQRRAIGKTVLSVSQLGFGAAPFGNLMGDVSDAQTHAAVDAAMAAGINYFDTAPFYGHGLSEHRLGEALRHRPRDSFVLSSKVGRLLRPQVAAFRSTGPFSTTLPFDIVYDYSYGGAMRSIEDSLQRLGLARIDIVFIHDVTPKWQGDRLEQRYKEAMDGAYRALVELRAAGTIGAIGVGINENRLLERFAADGDFDCFMLAGRYTLLDTSAFAALLPVCERKRISILLAAPYSSGILASGAVPGAKYWYADAPDEILARVRRMEALCKRHGITLQAAATQFPLAHPAIASVVAGYRAQGEVRMAVDACRKTIPPDFWRDMKESGLLDSGVPVEA